MAVHMHVTPYERREQPAGAGRAGGHALVSRIRDSLLSHSARTSAKANALGEGIPKPEACFSFAPIVKSTLSSLKRERGKP